nr:energy transducer TonB [Granulicella arctica]
MAIYVIAGSHLLNAQTLASAKPPGYPLAARAAGIDGPVVLKGTVSKEGKMQDIRVLSGAPELQQAAVDAVSGWTYKPYKHFGQIVEVDTTVTVNFNMGVGKQKAAEQAKAQAELAKVPKPAPSQDTPQQPTPKQ